MRRIRKRLLSFQLECLRPKAAFPIRAYFLFFVFKKKLISFEGRSEPISITGLS